MGDQLPEPNAMGPAGFFQDLAFEQIFDGLAPDQAFPQDRLGRLWAYVAARCAAGGDWGLKSPQLLPVLPLFLAACSSPVRVLVTRRDLAASRASWLDGMRRLWLERAQSFGPDSWQAKAAVPDFDTSPVDRAAAALDQAVELVNIRGVPLLEIQVDALKSDPAGQAKAIATFAGRGLTDEAASHLDPNLFQF